MRARRSSAAAPNRRGAPAPLPGPRSWRGLARPGSLITTLTPNSRGELAQELAHGLGALLPRGELRVDAQLVGAGEAGAAALLLDEGDDLRAVERRILDELQLHRFVRRVDARHAERPRGDAHEVALEERARGLGQL